MQLRTEVVDISGWAVVSVFGELDVATAPVKVAGKAVDATTTSQSEADENRGRELRRREERLGRLERQWHDLDEDCRDGNRKACAERDGTAREIDALRPTIPQRYEN